MAGATISECPFAHDRLVEPITPCSVPSATDVWGVEVSIARTSTLGRSSLRLPRRQEPLQAFPPPGPPNASARERQPPGVAVLRPKLHAEVIVGNVPTVLPDQHERWRGHLVRHAEPAGGALDERGLSGAEVAGQADHVTGDQELGQGPGGIAAPSGNGGGVERWDHHAAAPREPLAPDLRDRHGPFQDHPGGEVAERAHDLRVDQVHVLEQVRRAGLELVGERVPVAGRSAQHGVRDPDVLATQADLGEEAVQELAGGPDERQALHVLVVPRALADEHQVGGGTAVGEHDLSTPRRQPAPGADRGLAGQLLEPCGHRSATARRMAPAIASPAIRSTSGGASACPVARVKTVSPSHIVCAGLTALARPSCAAVARSRHPCLLRTALVATTPSTLLAPGQAGTASGGRTSPAGGRPSSSSTARKAFTTARGHTVAPQAEISAAPRPRAARPTPIGHPTPAPIPPKAEASSEAAWQAAYPWADPGRAVGSPTRRSNTTAAGTIGTRATPTSNPTPRSSSHRITPSAAARPNALPPVRRTPCTSSTSRPGWRRSVSRVPGAPPRTSPEPIVPGGGRTTVQPVNPTGSVQCPTRSPAITCGSRPSAAGNASPVGAPRPGSRPAPR